MIKARADAIANVKQNPTIPTDQAVIKFTAATDHPTMRVLAPCKKLVQRQIQKIKQRVLQRPGKPKGFSDPMLIDIPKAFTHTSNGSKFLVANVNVAG